ncbi:ABC transporter permease [Thermomonospora amylolytica]|uniref:ABC transporter permease n=1 Tax=Thermomonospora amylolytica TaxID=1411117 RepID=UPI000E6CDA5C|nr:ABC transporter permease [Thermomonospora amylolytica]
MTAVAVDRPAAPSLLTLTAVELRKMTDTRAGRWLLTFVVLVGAALVGVVLFAVPRAELTMAELFGAATSGVFVLLPVVGVLSVTSEWSQRTVLSTFTLVPRRERVVAAKLAAASVLTAAFWAVSALVAWAGRALAEALDRTDAGWTLPPRLLATTLLVMLLGTLGGVAFGMLFQNPPLAIVLLFVLPIAWGILGETVSALSDAAGWLDAGRTGAPFLEPGARLTGEFWARLAVSQAVWLGLPLVLGHLRVMRREVK